MVDEPNKGIATDTSWFNPKEINWVHYRGALNQVKVNKAVPSWAAPTAACHITSDIIAKHMAKDLHKIIMTQTYPQIWRDIQTIWIEKPDKDSSKIQNRRPINLEEPGFKAYIPKYITGRASGIPDRTLEPHDNGIHCTSFNSRLYNVSNNFNPKTNQTKNNH